MNALNINSTTKLIVTGPLDDRSYIIEQRRGVDDVVQIRLSESDALSLKQHITHQAFQASIGVSS